MLLFWLFFIIIDTASVTYLEPTARGWVSKFLYPYFSQPTSPISQTYPLIFAHVAIYFVHISFWGCYTKPHLALESKELPWSFAGVYLDSIRSQPGAHVDSMWTSPRITLSPSRLLGIYMEFTRTPHGVYMESTRSPYIILIKRRTFMGVPLQSHKDWLRTPCRLC